MLDSREPRVKDIIKILKNNGIGILPTDTLYGLVGSALSKDAVKKIYRAKKRDKNKQMIILISDIRELKLFKISLKNRTKKFLERIWPNKISVVLPCPNLPKKLSYLCPNKETLAFRMPKYKLITEIIKQVGPLVAPSANLQGKKPAETIKQARKYFGNNVDFYFNDGILSGMPSCLIEIKDNNIIVKRQGSIKIKQQKC